MGESDTERPAVLDEFVTADRQTCDLLKIRRRVDGSGDPVGYEGHIPRIRDNDRLGIPIKATGRDRKARNARCQDGDRVVDQRTVRDTNAPRTPIDEQSCILVPREIRARDGHIPTVHEMHTAPDRRARRQIGLVAEPCRVLGEHDIRGVVEEKSLPVSAKVRRLDGRPLHAHEFESDVGIVRGDVPNRHVGRLDDDELAEVQTVHDEARFPLEITDRLAVHEVVRRNRMGRERSRGGPPQHHPFGDEPVARYGGIQAVGQPKTGAV